MDVADKIVNLDRDGNDCPSRRCKNAQSFHLRVRSWIRNIFNFSIFFAIVISVIPRANSQVSFGESAYQK